MAQPASADLRLPLEADAFAEQPHILIVEDKAEDTERLQRILKDLRDPITNIPFRISAVTNIQAARGYLYYDAADIYIVDLVIPEGAAWRTEKEEAGKAFVREIVQRCNAGILVLSSLNKETETKPMLEAGADDYIEKYPLTWDEYLPDIIQSRIRAVWRRVHPIRPKKSLSFSHTNRVFLIGDWRFVVGNRILTRLNGETVRISVTEHAFLRYICTVEDHEISIETFNVVILGRNPDGSDWHPRMDNFLYRVKQKLGEHVQFTSQRGGKCRLLDINELKAGTLDFQR